MQIAIDGNEANIEKRVGIGEYAYQLLSYLYQIGQKHNFIIFLKEKPLAHLPAKADNWHYKVIGPKAFWTQIALPLTLLKQGKIELIFSPTHYAPRFTTIPSVISIMDLSFTKYPKLFKKSDLVKLNNWTRYSIKNAKRVLTISNFSKKEIIDYYGTDSSKIIVTYPGYNKKIYHSNYAKKEIDKIKDKYKLENYLIFVGTIQPRKNIERLLLAFSKILADFPQLKLVMVGKKGWLYESIFQTMKKEELKDKTVYLGFLDDHQLALLYNGAQAFVLPSLYEGFGLTVVEAMACSCPTVVSNISSLPEIGADASTYIDPFSIESISQGIKKIIRQDQRFVREKLIKKGLERVKQFSWEKTARETLDLLETLSK